MDAKNIWITIKGKKRCTQFFVEGSLCDLIVDEYKHAAVAICKSAIVGNSVNVIMKRQDNGDTVKKFLVRSLVSGIPIR
jgi:hypothetical protein